MPFGRNVFINCPFDAEYLPLLRPLLFAILDVGLNPHDRQPHFGLHNSEIASHRRDREYVGGSSEII